MKNINLNKMKNIYLPFLLLILFSGCKSTFVIPSFDSKDVPPIPNYNLESSWAVLPSKYTEEFKEFASSQLDTLEADVFYVYPTLNTDKEDPRWNAPINDLEQNDKVLNKAVLYQASALALSGKVYVPFYRQAHIRSFKMFNEGGKAALEIAYADVKKAFEVFLSKYNKERPIILLSHSQGTRHTMRLIADFFDEKELQNKLVAAYIPGIGVKPDLFKTIKPMTKPDEIGGFVSWNTYKKGYYPKDDKDWYDGSVTTNPITWDDSKVTTLEQHKGFLYTNKKIYDQALKIEISDGLVWSSNPKFPMRLFMSPIKNYHSGDINLFWQDVKENAALRLNTYLSKN